MAIINTDHIGSRTIWAVRIFSAFGFVNALLAISTLFGFLGAATGSLVFYAAILKLADLSAGGVKSVRSGSSA
jgi:hypothetical protein